MANVKVELLEEEIDGPLIDNDEDNAINDPLALDCDNGKLKKGKQELDQPCNYKENLETAPFELHLIIENIKKEEDKEDSRNADEETNDKPLILGTEFEDAKIEGKVAKEKTYQSIECDDVGQTAMDPLQLLDLQLQEVDEEPKDLNDHNHSKHFENTVPDVELTEIDSSKPFQCSECGKAFNKKFCLKQHMSIHTGENPFKCSDCGKSFMVASKLTIHRRLHTGDTPYVCSVCDKAFIHNVNFKAHMLKHSGDLPFKCTDCDKSYARAYQLKNHMRLHTGELPYECSSCGKCFARSTSLKTHMLYHSDDRPFKCSVCNKAFFSSGNYKKHVRIHTGEKPFKCSVCNKRFSQSSTRSVHMRTHEPK